MIAARLFLLASLALLWNKQVQAEDHRYALRYREASKQSQMVAVGKRGRSSTTRGRRSLNHNKDSNEVVACSGKASGKAGKGGKGGKAGGKGSRNRHRSLEVPCNDGGDDFYLFADDDDDFPMTGDDGFTETGLDDDEEPPSNEGLDITAQAADDDEEPPSNEGLDVVAPQAADDDEEPPSNEGLTIRAQAADDDEEPPSNEGIAVDRSRFQGGNGVIGIPDGE